MKDEFCTLRSYIRSDLARLDVPSKKAFMSWYFFRQSTFPWHVWLRIVQCARKKKFVWFVCGPLFISIFHHMEYKYGIHGNPSINIGYGFNVAHGDGVYLNCKSIGNNVTVFQNVTIGNGGGIPGIPVVEDNVTVYAGAVVVGGITLHEGCSVGANAFVNKDVTARKIVAGIPAKVINSREF